MPWSSGRCPACGVRMGNRELRGDKPGLYRCRKCKTAIRLETNRGDGSKFSVVPNEHGELDLKTIPRV